MSTCWKPLSRIASDNGFSPFLASVTTLSQMVIWVKLDRPDFSVLVELVLKNSGHSARVVLSPAGVVFDQIVVATVPRRCVIGGLAPVRKEAPVRINHRPTHRSARGTESIPVISAKSAQDRAWQQFGNTIGNITDMWLQCCKTRPVA